MFTDLSEACIHGAQKRQKERTPERNYARMDRTGPSGTANTAIGTNGAQYCIIGNTRVKITEHFPAKGKRIDELIARLIVNEIRVNTDRTA